MNSLVKAHEFFGQMQAGNRSFRLINTNIESDRNLLKGTFTRTRIRDGLTIHYSDVTNLCDLQTETEAPPHLGIKLFFCGSVTASIGDRDIPMPLRQAQGRWIPSATLFHQKEPELFRRRAEIGDRVRKFTVKIMPDWLESGDVLGHASARGLRRFMSEKLSALSWTPSPSLLALAEQAIKPPVFEPHLHRLYVESRILGVIAEAFALLTDGGAGEARPGLSIAERRRLLQAEELLRETAGIPSVEEIAAKIGVSVNTLQRLFHAGHGTTVFHYVRMRKLEQARLALENEGVSIAQAAYIAGYNSSANFSTAFKRRYGFTPKQSRR
ncbi:MAG: helix-turn-helix transcriptional regulator [Rhizobiales bacterium]|nr:helix-turn-helix transcriptional regulator [Hyphomicrobiales bacterium]OJY07413.1 MAG: transcriptional regulator [Rhizobiales bacterium 63-22]